ncbi:unnamed protein product, partial [Dicrocoelium dendriticum]
MANTVCAPVMITVSGCYTYGKMLVYFERTLTCDTPPAGRCHGTNLIAANSGRNATTLRLVSVVECGSKTVARLGTRAWNPTTHLHALTCGHTSSDVRNGTVR